MRLKASVGILAAAMVLTLSACEQRKKDEGMNSGQGMGATETGCCQHAENACAGDVTKSQCDQMTGKFHKDHMCHTDTGKCARK
ncbi:hypothetical protein BTJ40_00600 [Microbulbifer sp. A4B17]|uniref:hypothetical protein n=1 Tax=Microbulbifer sp. A4B17 TaxID=359370 RepID=UPI000D52DA1F|nr:hypothetical protein [Microbulbifer sp. A4B17]AWF79445.1 hypothetical protein BTJ40_00600 [Microbulbifer sp. A4B17]